MGKTHLAPGFRFHPTDVELVRYYLKRKVMGKHNVDAIAEVDIYKFEPSDLPDKSYLRTGDLKWYFFCPRGKKYGSGSRLNRATVFGFWKTTGKDRDVIYNDEVVGKIKTLVYHQGRSPWGERTDWVMHEYRLEDKKLAVMNVVQDAYVLCAVFRKDGPGPRNGAQYGAPFREEDWSDEDKDTDNNAPTSIGCSTDPGPSKQISQDATSSHAPRDLCAGLMSESCLSDMTPSTSKLPLDDAEKTPVSAVFPDAIKTPTSAMVPQTPGDGLSSLLDNFVEDENFLLSGYKQNEVMQESNQCGHGEAPVCFEGEDIFSELVDLTNLDGAPSTASHVFEIYNCNPTENTQLFLELQDLSVPLTPAPVQTQNPDNNECDCQIPDWFGSLTPSSASVEDGTYSTQNLLQQPSQPYFGFSGHSERRNK